jgi:hypothetical protein
MAGHRLLREPPAELSWNSRIARFVRLHDWVAVLAIGWSEGVAGGHRDAATERGCLGGGVRGWKAMCAPLVPPEGGMASVCVFRTLRVGVWVQRCRTESVFVYPALFLRWAGA